jgi:endonuclease YncB( thermonuclease family)
MNIPFLRSTLRAAGLALVALGLTCAAGQAETLGAFKGVPVVLDSSALMLDGKTLTLWGIDTLAPDQHCWRGARPWRCGEQATFALKHLVESNTVQCHVKDMTPGNKIFVQCFCRHGNDEVDVAAYLVKRGWALTTNNLTPSPYVQEQSKAQDDGRGIWTSRFQTAEDWKNGIQNYINDDSDDEGEGDETP